MECTVMFSLLDIGFDTAVAILEVLEKERSNAKYRPSRLLLQMVRPKVLGRKTGRVFFQWTR